MRLHTLAMILLAASVAGCGLGDAAVEARLILIDTHVDLPYRLTRNYENVAALTDGGEFDYPRARDGGVTAAFMSIYVPVEKQVPGTAKDYADHLIDLVEATVARNANKFVIATSPKDVLRASGTPRVALALGIENGAAIEGGLDNVAYFHKRGVRYITLAHGKWNLIADSSYDKERPWGGLSDYGAQVVEEMNRVGVIVDVSHISDEAVRDVLEVSQTPVLATHSAVRAFTPGWERNLSDELIRAIAAQGGVIQVAFGSVFLTEDANAWYSRYAEAAAGYRAANGFGQYEPIPEFETAYRAANPYPYASIDDVLDHIDHVVALTGVEHVGFGSDFDGVGDSLPEGLKSVADYPLLIEGLRGRGYSEDDILKIAGRNTLRVWKLVEDHARITQALAAEQQRAQSGRYGRFQ